MTQSFTAPQQLLATIHRQPRGGWLHRFLVVPVAVACLLVAGCSSPPAAVRFHSLLGSNATMAVGSNAVVAGMPLSVVVAPVGIPPGVDQPQWLVRRADDTLQMLEQDRWAAPLADEFRAALRARLASRWGIVDGSLPRSVDSAGKSSWRLVVEVQRIDARPAADTLLDVRWTLLPPQRTDAAVSCSAHIVEPVRGDGTVPIADAYRRSVVRLADQIGGWLRNRAGSAGAGTDCSLPIAPLT